MPALPVLLYEFSSVPDLTVPSWNSRCLSSFAILLFKPALIAAALRASNSNLAYYSFLSLSLSLAVNSFSSLFRIFSNFFGYMLLLGISYGFKFSLPWLLTNSVMYFLTKGLCKISMTYGLFLSSLTSISLTRLFNS